MCECGGAGCRLDLPKYECPVCGKLWHSAAVASDCCGDWLGYD